MKKFCQVFLAFLTVLNLFVSYSFVSNAAGTTTMFLSSNSPKVGDTLKLTVTGSASSTITVKYNATILVFQSCDASGYTQSGNSVSFTGKSGNINFSVAQPGDANIIVSSNTLSGCSTQIKVTGSADNASASQTVETQSEETQAEEVTTEETPEETAEPVEDFSGLGDATHHVTVMTPDILLNDSMVETTYTTDADTYTLYQFSGVSNEFYYVYGEDEEGNVGWYVFDSSKNQVSRADTAVLSMIGSGKDTDVSDDSKVSEVSEYIDYAVEYAKENYRNILAIAILLIAVIIVIRINVRVFRKASDDEEDDDGSDIFADLDSPKKESLFAKVHNDYEDDEDDDDEDEEDEDDDEEDDDVAIASLDLSVVNEALDEEDEDDEEDDEEEERSRGLFFKKKKDQDVWGDLKSTEKETPVEPKTSSTPKNSSSGGNREINLMDLNNL